MRSARLPFDSVRHDPCDQGPQQPAVPPRSQSQMESFADRPRQRQAIGCRPAHTATPLYPGRRNPAQPRSDLHQFPRNGGTRP